MLDPSVCLSHASRAQHSSSTASETLSCSRWRFTCGVWAADLPCALYAPVKLPLAGGISFCCRPGHTLSIKVIILEMQPNLKQCRKRSQTKPECVYVTRHYLGEIIQVFSPSSTSWRKSAAGGKIMLRNFISVWTALSRYRSNGKLSVYLAESMSLSSESRGIFCNDEMCGVALWLPHDCGSGTVMGKLTKKLITNSLSNFFS